MQKIIIPNKLKNRIKEMQKEYSVIFLTARAGDGKTTVAKEYLKSRKISYTFVSSVQEDFQKCIQGAKQKIIVIDDFQNINSENEEFLKSNFYEILRRHSVFILSRAYMPAWLKPYQIIGQVGSLDGAVLHFTNQEVKEFLEMNQIHVDDSELYEICRVTQNYPLALKFLVSYLRSGESNRSKLTKKVLQDIFDYYDEMVVQNWNRELYAFVLQMGGFESFSLELAAMVSGNPSIQQIIDEANRAGSFLEWNRDVYTITPFFRRYLIYKQKKELSMKTVSNIYYNAGLYYELHEDMKNALKYYSLCGNEDKVRDILIRNSNMHPGVSYYLEVEEYYRAFPKETILKTPDLMCGMSMLCSLCIQVEESEYWYEALKAYFQNLKRTDFEYKYVKGKLYWLDISLPHRGSADIEKLIVNAVTQRKNKEFVLQEMSVTSNLPSVLNGGKDLSNLVLRADVVYPVMKPVLPIVLGEAGEGLTDIALAEKMIEQGDSNVYQIMNYINSGMYEASTKGKMETEFVGTVLMQRLYLAQGNPDTAYQLMMDFKKQVEEKKQMQLIPNLNAVLAYQELKTGKKERTAVWLREEAPNENKRFNVFERYRYMVKVRYYIAEKKYMEAITISDRLIQYGIDYDRTIVRIQARLLLAIILYRTENDTWKEILEEALLEAQKYRYVRMIAEEGVAILPLLQESRTVLDKNYKKELLQQVKEQAMMYPSYLKVSDTEVEGLTATEKQVLKLLGRGMKNKEIAEFLNISLNTVAYHTKNIYQKLGINNRSQATNIAKTMEL